MLRRESTTGRATRLFGQPLAEGAAGLEEALLPFLHARLIGAVAPNAGETVTHIGAGTGYYSAILSMLVLPNGVITAYEVDEKLAAQARLNLAQFENVTVVLGNAVSVPIPDVIYVNAGVVAPPGHWLDALRPDARMIFPWRPTPQTALAALVTHTAWGFGFKPLMPAWFIPCLGASETSATDVLPDTTGAWRTRSLHLRRDRAPDESERRSDDERYRVLDRFDDQGYHLDGRNAACRAR
jgi:protein-L-isoaspartate(D-aspartate) O-methyltransferase